MLLLRQREQDWQVKVFAVVTEEVRILSKETTLQVRSIKKLVEFVINEIEKSTMATDEAFGVFFQQIGISSDVSKYFIDLTKSINDNTKLFEVVIDKSNLARNRVDDVFNEITSISAISSENALSSEKIITSLEAVQKKILSLNNSSIKLKKIIEDVSIETSRYNV